MIIPDKPLKCIFTKLSILTRLRNLTKLPILTRLRNLIKRIRKPKHKSQLKLTPENMLKVVRLVYPNKVKDELCQEFAMFPEPVKYVETIIMKITGGHVHIHGKGFGFVPYKLQLQKIKVISNNQLFNLENIIKYKTLAVANTEEEFIKVKDKWNADIERFKKIKKEIL